MFLEQEVLLFNLGFPQGDDLMEKDTQGSLEHLQDLQLPQVVLLD